LQQVISQRNRSYALHAGQWTEAPSLPRAVAECYRFTATKTRPGGAHIARFGSEDDRLDNDAISRREFGLVAGATGMGLMASGPTMAASELNGASLNYSHGLIESPPTYFELLEPVDGSKKPPMVLISGGAHTGTCYLATADGRPGWAHAFVRAGYKVVVPDWPGVGRSGHIPLDKLTGEVVVEGLGKVLASLDQPAIVMTHSMSGAYGWKLVERFGERIAKVVAVAPGPPGNSRPYPKSSARLVIQSWSAAR
jgi:hypothetical protein